MCLIKSVQWVEPMNDKVPVQDRVWAVVAHISAIAMGMGILLPVLGWSESRRKSNYASFQCMQALGYQTLGYTIWILTTLVVVVITGVGVVARIVNAVNPEEEIFAMMTGHSTFMFVLIGIYFVLPVIAAIACAFGRDFRYPLIGNNLARYLNYNFTSSTEEQIWLIEEHEDRWVASMGHFSVIIILWGMLVPLTAWILQGKRSSFLKFQTIQALVFQAGTTLLYILSMAMYFGGAIFFILSVGGMDAANLDSGFGMIGLVIFLGSMLCVFGIVLLVPLLHIMGQWAGYRILKGDDYRYPIVGKLVERRLSRDYKPPKEELPA